MLVVGGGVMKSWSSTQGSIAMSSGEAEYYACTKVAVEALGFKSLAADLGGPADSYIHRLVGG